MIPAGTIVIAHSHDDDAALEQVRAEIRRMGYTQDDVRILRRNGQLLVEAKVDVCPNQ